MPIGQSLIPEFDLEMAGTRRLLERVPPDKGPWKPHPKSFSLGHLSQLVSWMPGWITNTLRDEFLDLARVDGYTYEKTDVLVRRFDENVRSAREALTSTPDEAWSRKWELRRGNDVLWAAPRTVVVRNHINHLVHHRGQLTVYLRLNDVPLPSLYGPTADERTF